MALQEVVAFGTFSNTGTSLPVGSGNKTRVSVVDGGPAPPRCVIADEGSFAEIFGPGDRSCEGHERPSANEAGNDAVVRVR